MSQKGYEGIGLNPKKIHFEELLNIVESAIDISRNTVIVCDRHLAKSILQHIQNVYFIDIGDTCVEDEGYQYLSIYFGFKGNIEIYCENAKIKDSYKLSSLHDVDYIITNNMTFSDAIEFLQASGHSTWKWYEVEKQEINPIFEEYCNSLNAMLDKYTSMILESVKNDGGIKDILLKMFCETLIHYSREEENDEEWF